MTTDIRASASPGEVRVAVLHDGVLTDFALWRPGAPDGVGDIHRGRVLKAVRAMAGAFVAIDGAEGFLPDSEGAKGLTEGSAVVVRIARAAQGGKGPRLSARLDENAPDSGGSGGVALLRRGPDPISRFRVAWPDARVIVDTQALAARIVRLSDNRRDALAGEASAIARPDVVPDAFGDDLASEIDALAEPVVDLPNGARIVIYPTPALVAIDVDSGGAIAGGRDRAGHHQAVNNAVIPALARQIRLRNLSGAIVVDLAGMPVRRRIALAPALTSALEADPLRPRFLGFTGLGLAEILRSRVHPPLHELLTGPHAAGLAALRAIATNLDTDPRKMPVLRAAPLVVAALRRDTIALGDLAERAGQALIMRADPAMREEEWQMEFRNG